MIGIVRRILKISKERKKSLQVAMVLSFIEGIFIITPEILVMIMVYLAMSNKLDKTMITYLSIGLVVSVIFRAIFRRVIDGMQSGTGYKIFADERMLIGEHLKRLPMGYFTEGAIGKITSVITTDIVFAEMYGMQTISKIVTAYVSTVLGTVMMFFFDWRIAIVALVTLLFGSYALNKMDKLSIKHGALRQKISGRLVGAIIEFIKGISVIKAFNLQGEQMKKTDDSFVETRDAAIDFEQNFAGAFMKFHFCFAFGITVIIILVAWLMMGNNIDQKFGVMILLYSFSFFQPFQVLGSVNALSRIMEVALDRYDEVMNLPVLDENSKYIKLNKFDIEFKNVTFAYEKRNIIKDMSFTVSEKSMTALVGKSGCGKSTITSLIARFWDVQKGQVIVGGVDVKDMSCESLLENISMVFQNVYLFNNTIINNIKFSKPEATMDEVIEACKKARCYEFIMAYENGFETIVEEAGRSLSGGEKQRISIARAILKDAPIVLLDEATASVDPDNEKYIQEAISELVKDKTLIVIAHKLKTIRLADQIIVIDNGEIVQTGNHDSLVNNKGIYNTLWEKRQKARHWKITNETKGGKFNEESIS